MSSRQGVGGSLVLPSHRSSAGSHAVVASQERAHETSGTWDGTTIPLQPISVHYDPIIRILIMLLVILTLIRIIIIIVIVIIIISIIHNHDDHSMVLSQGPYVAQCVLNRAASTTRISQTTNIL